MKLLPFHEVIGSQKPSGEKVIDSLVFLFASFGLFVSPGPTNGLLAAAAASAGRSQAAKLLIAQSAGYFLAILMARLIVSPLIGGNPNIALALKLGAAAYLAYIAIRLWNWEKSASLTKQLIRFWDVFVTTFFNPKALIFAFGYMPSSQINWLLLMATLIFVVPITGTIWIVLGSQANLFSLSRLIQTIAAALAVFALGIAIMGIRQFAS
jgi:threonine/homoserine/homoserine lactone efflux protein